MADLSVKPVAQEIKPMPTMSLGEMVNFGPRRPTIPA
jgi:hypothetical protein